MILSLGVIAALLAYIAWKLRYVAGLLVGLRQDLRQLFLTDMEYEHISEPGKLTNRLHVMVSLLEMIRETTRATYKRQAERDQ